MKNLILSFATFTLIGCGGGIDGSRKLSDLSASETKDACLELADDYPEKTVDCGMGVTVTIGLTTAECSDNTPAPSSCTATVDDARECTSAIYDQSDADLCMDKPLPAACAKLQGC